MTDLNEQQKADYELRFGKMEGTTEVKPEVKKQEQKKEEIKKDVVENKSNKESDTLDNKKVDELNKKIELLEKQKLDTQKWGQKQRQSYVLAKKRFTEKVTEFKNNSILDDEDLSKLEGLFTENIDEEVEIEEDKPVTPIKKTISKLEKVFEKYKEWNTDASADLKFESFFKHLDLVKKDKLKDIMEYIDSVDDKEALEYVLTTGEDIYNKFYKHVLDKGDAFSYIDGLLKKNKELEDRIAKMKEELDDKIEKSYTDSNTTNKSKKDDQGRFAYEAIYGKKY